MKTQLIAVASVLTLGACAAVPPAGPSVLALPSQGKSLEEFQGEDMFCRQFAESRLPDPARVQQGSTQNSVGSLALGTALGAGAGLALGSLGAAAGTGAAIGAVAGGLIGASAGASQAHATSAGLQQTYDVGYIQCMASKGNSVQSAPGPVVFGSPFGSPYAYPPVTIGLGFGYGFGGYGGYGHRYWR